MLARERFGNIHVSEYAVVHHIISHWCFTQCSRCLKSAVGAKNPSICDQPFWNSASTSGFEADFLIFIFSTPHCPLWSLCGLQLLCPSLRYLLTVGFLSQQAPSSLLEALEQHLASLEGKKVKDSTAASRCVNPSITFSPFPFQYLHQESLRLYFFLQCGKKIRACFLTGRVHCQMQCHRWPAQGCLSPKWMNGRSRRPSKRSRLDSKHWRCSKAYVQWSKTPSAMSLPCLFLISQEKRLKELSKRPSFTTTDTSPISTSGGTISTAPAIDLFSTPSCSNGYWFCIRLKQIGCTLRLFVNWRACFSSPKLVPFSSAVQWRHRVTSSTCSRLSRPPCRPARAGSPRQQRGQVTENRL